MRLRGLTIVFLLFVFSAVVFAAPTGAPFDVSEGIGSSGSDDATTQTETNAQETQSETPSEDDFPSEPSLPGETSEPPVTETITTNSTLTQNSSDFSDDTSGSTNTTVTIFMALCVLNLILTICLIGAIYYLFKQKDSNTAKQASSSVSSSPASSASLFSQPAADQQMVTQLKAYMDANTPLYSIDAIKTSLLSQGYSRTDIEAAQAQLTRK